MIVLVRQLIVVVFVMALGWLLRRLFGTNVIRGAERGAGTPPPASDGEMVRDRVCNTFLPRGSALTSQVAGELHFFCSERCRQAFLERS